MESIKKHPWILYYLLAPFIAWTIVFYILPQFSDVRKQEPGKPTDLLAQLTGAKIVQDGRIKDLYNYDIQKEYQAKVLGSSNFSGLLAFRNPPLTAVLYSLLPIDDPVSSFWVMIYINSAAIFIALFLLRESFTFTCITSTVVVFMLSFWMTLIGGQPTGLLLLLVTLVYLAIKNGYPGVAGLLAAFLFLKPNLLLFVPYMLLLMTSKKQVIKYLIWFFVTLSTILIVNSIFYGTDFIKTYTLFLANSEDINYGTHIENNTNVSNIVYTISSSLGKLYIPWVSVGLTILVNIFFFLAMLFYKKNIPNKYIFGLLCLFVPLLNIHTLYTDLLFHLLTLAIFIPYLISGQKLWRLLGLLLLIVELPFYSYANLEWLISVCILVVAYLIIIKMKSVEVPIRNDESTGVI